MDFGAFQTNISMIKGRVSLIRNCRVYGQRLCLLFSQISVFYIPTPPFLSIEICAIL